MDHNIFLPAGFLLSLLIILYLLQKLLRVQKQLSLIQEALSDFKNGNRNRRVLTRESDMTKQICHDLNEIAIHSQKQLARQKQSELAYKRLMTSLSHDVKTPLASLVGYLEAVEQKLVTGEEKDAYLHVAFEKSLQLKHFVEHLFEWVKLDCGEQIFHPTLCDLNELSRSILADWIPKLEAAAFSYEIEIPDCEYQTKIDTNAYTRILNNLFDNALLHSHGTHVSVHLYETEEEAALVLADNGTGIDAADLPHIFERMYQCDHSRTARGNGLGLSIVKELISLHQGQISVLSTPDTGTEFTVTLPRIL